MEHRDLLKLTTDIVSAWAANNTAKADELVSVISSVYRSLDSAGTPAATVQETPVPAVPVRKSVTPDYLVCLRSEEHTSELQSLMRISYAVFCLKKKKNYTNTNTNSNQAETNMK